MIALLLPHTGAHAAQHAPLMACLPPFFRRVLRGPWRKPAVPASHPMAGAATPPGDRYDCCEHCEHFGDDEQPDRHDEPCPEGCNDAVPVLGGRMLSEVRAEYDAALSARRAREHSDIMHAGYARAVDRLRRDAGLPTVEEMHAEYFALPQRRTEPGRQPWETAGQPVYQQAPQLKVAPELAKGLIA